jgi:hypothetical protein
VGHEDPRGARQFLADELGEYLIRDTWIECAQGVIKEIDVSGVVVCACERNSLSLTAREIYSAFTDLGRIAVR